MRNIDILAQDLFLRQRLAKIRKSKGMTQKDLSELSGLSTSTISNIESGENSYSLRSLIRVVEALGYEINIERKDRNGKDL